VRRLFVVDGGRLAGVVTHPNLLGPSIRSNEEMRVEIDDAMFGRALHANPIMVRTTAEHGVVTLTGRSSTRATATPPDV
jgi:hypothetical protein